MVGVLKRVFHANLENTCIVGKQRQAGALFGSGENTVGV